MQKSPVECSVGARKAITQKKVGERVDRPKYPSVCASHGQQPGTMAFIPRKLDMATGRPIHFTRRAFHPTHVSRNPATMRQLLQCSDLGACRLIVYVWWFVSNVKGVSEPCPNLYFFVCGIYGSILSPRPCKRSRNFYQIAILSTSWSTKTSFGLRRT